MADLLRRGRLDGEPTADLAEFVSGTDIGAWVFEHNLDIDEAHLVMLVEQGIVDRSVGGEVAGALAEIRRLGFEALERSVDTHVTTERAVIARTGEAVGGQLHTARSRNDKFATWLRMAVREQLLRLGEAVLDLRGALVTRGSETADWLLAAYTSLQRAQPTTLGHHLLAHEGVLRRQFDRLVDAYDRADRSPLGSVAVAGTGFDIDRRRTAELLGFDGVVRNAMDGVATRDVAVEAVAAAANLMVSVSRLCEELVRWSGPEFGFLELADRFTGTSSVMPQKKNPYAAELARARASTVAGNLGALASLLEGLPMAYDHDVQEATRLTLEALEEAADAVDVVGRAVEAATFDRDRLAASVEEGFVCATELADTIVRETDRSFRTAHHVVATLADRAGPVTPEAVREAAREATGEPLDIADGPVERALDPEANVRRRDSLGGPGEVAAALDDAVARRDADVGRHRHRRAALERADSRREDAVAALREGG